MKNLKYILTVFVVMIAFSAFAKQYQGTVLLADEPIKGAKILDKAENVLATTDKEGNFSFESDAKEGMVQYKDLSIDLAFKAKNLNKVTLVPAEADLLEMIQENPTLEKCEIFLANYEASAQLKKVMKKKEEAIFSSAYLTAVKQYDVTKLESYLQLYDTAKFQTKAEKTIEVVAWQMARLNNSVDSYQDYLAKYPDSEAAKEAAERLAEVDY